MGVGEVGCAFRSRQGSVRGDWKMNHFILGADVPLQVRKAQNLPRELQEAVRARCLTIRELKACYLLDARRPDTGATALLVALSLDDEEQMQHAADTLWTVLSGFPSIGTNAYVLSATSLGDSISGGEFYIRQN